MIVETQMIGVAMRFSQIVFAVVRGIVRSQRKSSILGFWMGLRRNWRRLAFPILAREPCGGRIRDSGRRRNRAMRRLRGPAGRGQRAHATLFGGVRASFRRESRAAVGTGGGGGNVRRLLRQGRRKGPFRGFARSSPVLFRCVGQESSIAAEGGLSAE
jgi:hypothetical protein